MWIHRCNTIWANTLMQYIQYSTIHMQYYMYMWIHQCITRNANTLVAYNTCEYSTAVQYLRIQLYSIMYVNTSGHYNICEYINAIQYTVYRLNKPEYLWTWRRINRSNPVYIWIHQFSTLYIVITTVPCNIGMYNCTWVRQCRIICINICKYTNAVLYMRIHQCGTKAV